MNLTPADIEKIVRQVLQTLLGGNTSASGHGSVQVTDGSSGSLAIEAAKIKAAPVLSARNFVADEKNVSSGSVNSVVHSAPLASSNVSPVPSPSSNNGPVGTKTSAAANEAAPANELVLDADVISATLLANGLPKGKDQTVQSLRVKSNAVITPAAKDLLREKRIQIVRGGLKAEPNEAVPNVAVKASAKPQRLLVAGTSNAMDALSKQVCPKQANVLSKLADDGAVLRSVLDGLKAGHQAAVIWVDSPHHVCWQAARNDSLRPVVVSQWSELKQAIQDVPANLLILSKKQWTLPALGNATRTFFEHLKKNN